MSKSKERSFLNNWAEVGGPDSGIVRESSSGREGERRIVALDPLYDPANEQFIYNYRKESRLPFVQAYGSEVLKLEKPPKAKGAKAEPADPYNHMAVVTERIPHRLVDAPQLTYPESLYVLDRALQGYETAYDKAGPMRVNDRMIGFNNQGQAKVWINEDFANNHPSYPRRRLMSTRVDSKEYLEGRYQTLPVSSDEADMVQDVVDTVENYCEEGRFHEPFASRIHQRNLGFGEARRLVRDEIIENRIPVPDRVDLFTNIVRGYRKTTQSTYNTTPQHQQQQYSQQSQYSQPQPQQQYSQQSQYSQPQQQYTQQISQQVIPQVRQQVVQQQVQQVVPQVRQQLVQQQVAVQPQVRQQVVQQVAVPELRRSLVQTPVRQQVVQQVVPQVRQQFVQQQVVVPEVRSHSAQNYRFNYLPVNEPYRPNIFASRVGTSGVYQGARY